MAKRKSIDFLPSVFKTATNQRLLNATVDQLIQEPALKKIYGYIGQQDQSGVYKKNDYYILESDKYSQFYQLEPGVVVKKKQINTNTYKIENVYSYPEILNQLSSDGGLNNDHSRLFTNESYSYNGFVDLDKLTNYRQYYWVPNGPYTVDVNAGGLNLIDSYTIQRVSYSNNQTSELISASLGRSGYQIAGFSHVNPIITLIRGGSYTFNIGQPGNRFWIQTEIGTSGQSAVQANISTRQVLGVQNNGLDSGSITFNVPLKDAQDNIINLPSITNIDMITDVPYNQMQGQNYDDFITNTALDGVRAFDNKLIYINNTDPATWSGVPENQRSGIWRIVTNVNKTILSDLISQTTAVLQLNSTSITVADSTGIVNGQVVYAEGIPVGTTVVSGAGTNTLVLSAPATLSNNGVPVRFYDVLANPDYRKMRLSYYADWPNNSKTFVQQGTVYGHIYVYKDGSGYINAFPTLSATQDTLYYQDETNPEIYGIINLVEPGNNPLLNVSDIIGKDQYTSPNGVKFTSGLKIQFTGNVSPSSYKNNEYVVENVGKSIRLVAWQNLQTPELINENLSIFYSGDSGAYDLGNYDGTYNAPIQKDYISINRCSVDGNSWSRNNRWFHREVLQYAADFTKQVFVFDANYQAKRPIVEFLPDLKLYNYGTNFLSNITVLDTAVNNAFSEVEGLNSGAVNVDGVFLTDGIELLNGTTLVFANDADPDVRKTVYRVESFYPRDILETDLEFNNYKYSLAGTNKVYLTDLNNLFVGMTVKATGTNQDLTTFQFLPDKTTIKSIDKTNAVVTLSNNLLHDMPAGTTLQFNNTSDQIHLVPVATANNGDCVLALEGTARQGQQWYYLDGTWISCQQKTSRPQFPLFDVLDPQGYSYSDTNLYPSTSFSGSYLFGYAMATGGTRDTELGFPLVYKTIGNIGDIVFNNYYASDTFNYNYNKADKSQNVNTGFAAVIIGWNDYDFANGWYAIADKSKQYICQTIIATNIVYNHFDLGLVYQNSFYENNVFVTVNGVTKIVDTDFYLQTSNQTTILSFSNDLVENDRVFIKIFGNTSNYGQTYSMPKNLTNNSENLEFSTVTLGEMRNHLIDIGKNSLDLVGTSAGSNNFRDINYNYITGKLLQHSASMRPAALMLANPDVDPIKAINYNLVSYENFKYQLVDYINNLEFANTSKPDQCLDTILAFFYQNATPDSPFYYSDMIAGGDNNISNSYTIANTTYRSYNLTNSYVNKPYNYQAVLVYLNNVLLVKDRDYSISNYTVTLSTNLYIVKDDVLKIVEYADTFGCSIPATPTKLGLWPKFYPVIAQDDTYRAATNVIVGHDGSRTVAWNDYRDSILLEYEKRVYNNIAVEYANSYKYDVTSVEPGAFRKTDFSFGEWTQLLSTSYLSWAGRNVVNVFANNLINNDLFSFNYSNATDKVFHDTLPGYWRGIYNYFFDTDRPHSHPWEMLGFSIKPSWWNGIYGDAPYTGANKTMWDHLELGLVYNGSPDASYIDSRYSRPGLSQIIPVDDHGNLLAPVQCVVDNYDPSTASTSWRVGDQSPQETAWRRSSSYPFAVQLAWALARPAEYCALKYNTRDVVYNSKLNQVLNIKNNNRQFDFSITTADQYIPGLNLWIKDRLTSLNLDVMSNWVDIANNSTFNLIYKMAGYTDKNYLTVIADQVSPQSTNTSILIPQENYNLAVTKSAPVARAVYSAVVVEKTVGGYQVNGFDKERPYFLTIPSVQNNNYYTVSSGSETGIIYKDNYNTVVSYPYSTIFSNKQQVVDFLISYGRYLSDQGFVFSNVLADNTTVSDFTLAVKEFLFWDQQNWGTGTVLSLTPAGTSLGFNSLFGIVDGVSNDNNYTKVINSDGVTLTGRDYRVYREDNSFSIDLKNTQKGIHLLDIAIVQYEHSLIFDNTTVFNDVLYDEIVGSRQFRLRLDGYKTSDWNGSLYAPGFLVNFMDIPQWSSYTDYSKGDIVLFKSQYYAAQNFVPGASKFNSSDWYKIDGGLLSKQLIPNMASGAAQFETFYDPDVQNLNNSADLHAKHAFGFQQRQYMTDLGLDRTSQYKFYLGMIKQKGSQAVVNAFLRNNQNRINTDLELTEQWAVKLGDYGGTQYVNKLEFSIANCLSINNNYLFEFAADTDASSNLYNTIKPMQMVIRPDSLNLDIFAATESQRVYQSTAGPVTTSEISASSFDINKIYNLSSISVVLGESSKIWIAADNNNQWGVYRLTQNDNIIVVQVNQTSPTEITFTTNKPHGLARYDYVMLKNAKIQNAINNSNVLDLSGFYRISAVNANTFTVKITNTSSISSSNLNASLFKLVNVRYDKPADFASFIPARGWLKNEVVYIDKGPNGYRVLQNQDNWQFLETKTPVYTKSTDNFGSSIKIDSSETLAIVGASGKGQHGQAYVYSLIKGTSWQEIGILNPQDTYASNFGSVVDFNDLNIATIGAPASNNKGSVYAGVANSQSISLNQVIHYDNIYYTSTGISSSNSYVLIDSSINLNSLANNMPILGNGIPAGTRIANVQPAASNPGALYSLIGLTKTATIPANTPLTVYPNVAPGARFGTAVSASSDGGWLFVGDPVSNNLVAYKYQSVDDSQASYTGNGSNKNFYFPSTALSNNLGSRDVKVYLNGALQVPDLDYYVDPGSDIVRFAVAPALKSTVGIYYNDYFQECNYLELASIGSVAFGSSVSTNNTGSIVIVGDPLDDSTLDITYSKNGVAYIYERVVENFISNGSARSFNTVNTLTLPSVKVDGIVANASYTLSNNFVLLQDYPAPDSIISIETNQFSLRRILQSDTGQANMDFGRTVKVCPTNCSFYVGAPNYNNTSTKNGIVYRYVDLPRVYGVASATIKDFSMPAGASVRINDFLVTFSGGDKNQCVSDINAAGIPGIVASLDSGGYLQISTNSTQEYNKLRIRTESLNALGVMGIEPVQLVQKIMNPLNQDTENFGDRLSVSKDGKSLVVGATLSNSRLSTTFDNSTTTFDNKTVRWSDVIYRSGAAHLYEYQQSASETINDQGKFAYATLFADKTIGSLDRFATGVDIGKQFVLVGAPNGKLYGKDTGVLHVYQNATKTPIWATIREPALPFDSSLIERIYLYNTTTGKLIVDLPVIDILQNRLPDSMESYLDYSINYDPAVYSNVPTTVTFSFDTKNNWGQEKVGTLWWDTNSIKYYDNSQGSTIDQFYNWSLAFPSSSVNVYEWIESDRIPSNYAALNPQSPPLYTVNDVYSTKVIIDDKTGLAVNRYYFWVKNSTRVQPGQNRPTALEIQNTIAQPKTIQDPFATVINSRSFAIFNASSIIGSDTNCVIQFKTIKAPKPVHTEWTLFDDGTDLGVAPEFLNKLCDSLANQDANSRQVPDIKLPKNMTYGVNIRPRQTMFSNSFTARKLFLEQVNLYAQQYPLVLTRPAAIAALTDYESEPASYLYKTRVENLLELSYLDTTTYHIGDKVLVASDETTNLGWSIYVLSQDSNFNRSWQIQQVQTYNVTNYWKYTDWYSTKYHANLIVDHIIDTENEISKLTLAVGDVIYIKNSSYGGWKYVLVNTNNLELLAQQNSTITFDVGLYDQKSAGLGFQTSSYESVGFSSDNNIEFRKIFFVIQNLLFINEYRPFFKVLIKLMIDTIATQHIQSDWIIKTSFVDIYHRVRGLDALPVYLPQPENIVTDFFNEVKPFHTKLKQYIAKYDNNDSPDIALTGLTDFDLQPYYNQVTKTYRSPDINNPIDTNVLAVQPVYKSWIANHTYQVKRVDIIHPGKNYDGTTTVVISGNGTGAKASAYILNGQIYEILMDDYGSGYTYAVANIYGIGSGAQAVPILGYGKARNMNTTIKFDRYTYFRNIQDWAANTSYVINDVVVYDSTPYRVTSAHTSGSKFDFTKFYVLRVKAWYPYTSFDAGDIVIYGNSSYISQVQQHIDYTGDNHTTNFSLASLSTYNIDLVTNDNIHVKADGVSQSENIDYVVIRDAVNVPVVAFLIPPATGVDIAIDYSFSSSFTSGAVFDTAFLSTFSGLWLDNACDRIWAYYSPKSGMAGKDLTQLIKGIEYPGVGIKGPDFNQNPAYDTPNFDYIAYDLSVTDPSGITMVYGNQAIDTNIKSDFTDSGLGLRPEDIIVLGGGFVDTINSHAPEEFVPGIISDTLDIKVRTLPKNVGNPDVKVISQLADGNVKNYSFDPAITGVSLPTAGIEKFLVFNNNAGPQTENIDYVVDWQNKTINFVLYPNTDDGLYFIMLGSTGVNPNFDTNYTGDGIRTDFEIWDNVLTDVQQAYVKINGKKVSNWQLVNAIVNNKSVLVVRFDDAPAIDDFIQIHLYDVAMGTRAYTQITEQRFKVNNNPGVYPVDYSFKLSNPSEYVQPWTAYSLVRLNGSDLIPSQQSYYVGDSVQTTFTLTQSYVKDYSIVSVDDITVVVDGVALNYLIDYTINKYQITGTWYVDVIFSNAPILGSRITISDASTADYRIYGTDTLILNPNVAITAPGEITVVTFGNHDPTNIYTKIFSGSSTVTTVLDLGFDNIGFEAPFDNELDNVIVSTSYVLPVPVTNYNDLYITVKDPGTTGGYNLSPYSEYYLETPTTVRLSSGLQLASNSTIVVRIFGTQKRQLAAEFRIFKDLQDTFRYYALNNSKTTKLVQDLLPSDQWVYVEDVTVLQNPDPTNNLAGVVFINGERIVYGFKDLINNRLGNIRRGTAGTGLADVHQSGTQVYDSGFYREIPNSRDQLITTDKDTLITNGLPVGSGGSTKIVAAGSIIRQGQLFVDIGDSIMDSTNAKAEFIREP
jgi:hypothetical protein